MESLEKQQSRFVLYVKCVYISELLNQAHDDKIKCDLFGFLSSPPRDKRVPTRKIAPYQISSYAKTATQGKKDNNIQAFFAT